MSHSMEFSDVLKASGSCIFSPNGDLLAQTQKQKLTLRNASSLAPVRTQNCRDVIDYIEWSSDSMYILCANYQRALVEVYSVADPAWQCRIDEGAAGLEAACWAPDGRHILTTAEFQLRVTVWSLVSQHVYYIRFPKFSCQVGVKFSNDGKFMAALERRDCKDYISLFTCRSWQMVQHFDVETSDAAGLAFSPDGRYLAVWDSSLFYKVCIYNLEGRLCGTYSAYENALGVKSVQWSPSSQLLSIGSYDQSVGGESVRLLNNLTWQCVTQFKHLTSVTPAPTRAVYREAFTSPAGSSTSTTSAENRESRYDVVLEDTVKLQQTKLDPEKPNPRMGIAWQRFSADSRYLATRNDLTPDTLWIWDVPKLRPVAILLQNSSLSDAAWHPQRNWLAFCSGGPHVYFWSPAGAICVRVPTTASLSVVTVRWAPDGAALLLADKDKYCLCHPGDILDSASS